MPKLKILSGPDIVEILQRFGFVIAAQKGSHVKLKRMEQGESQTLTVPNHQELDRGTTRAIFNQASRYVPQIELRKHFYTK